MPGFCPGVPGKAGPYTRQGTLRSRLRRSAVRVLPSNGLRSRLARCTVLAISSRRFSSIPSAVSR